jgi:hypothetical protein
MTQDQRKRVLHAGRAAAVEFIRARHPASMRDAEVAVDSAGWVLAALMAMLEEVEVLATRRDP